MCKSSIHTDEIIEMICSVARKKSKVRGNLRLEVLLESTHKWLDHELKEKQRSRKRRWEEMKLGLAKKIKIEDDTEMDDACTEDLLNLSDFFSNLKSIGSSPEMQL